MPKIIDERVVEMKFDNKQFEQNAQNSLKTLDNLKKSLNFNGATTGLQQFEKVSNGINLSGMESAIQTVQNRFSTLGTIADQIIRRMTDSALNMARRIGQEFTVQPMKTGFQEYETQINAVQTIMANTGAPIEKVNAALDELNAYADKTIYNFTEMTRNIGTFTAAGVDIDTSTAAIKGIANLSAVSGANAQDAARVMYQLSQAIAAGTVKLRDWISVENANIGGKVFQDSLKDTARIHGIAIDEMIEKAGSFRETLSDGWLTSDILLETLEKFTGNLSKEQLLSMGYTEEQAQKIYDMGITANDAATKVKTFTQLFDTLAEARQSGWTQSWEIIIGDFEEAKGLLTTISERFNKAIGDSANARNLVLQQWSDLGGRTLLIESVINVLDTLEGIAWSVKNAFYEIFPKVTADNLFNITSRIWEVTESLKKLFSFGRGARHSLTETSEGEVLVTDKFALLGPVLESISKIFKGFFAVVDAGIYVFVNFGKIVLGVLKMLAPLGSIILNFLGTIGDYLSSFAKGIKNGMALAKGLEFFEDVFAAINVAVFDLLSAFMTTENQLNGVVPNVKTAIVNIITPIANFVKSIYNYIVTSGFVSEAIDFFKNAVISIAMVIPMAISALASLLNKIKDYIKENELIERATSKISSVTANLINKVKLGYSAMRDFLKSVADFIKENAKISIIAEKIKEIFAPVGGFIGKFWGNLLSAFDEAKQIDVSSISGIFEKIKAKMAPFKRIFTELYSPIEGMSKIGIAIKNLFEKIKNAIISGWEAFPDVFKNIVSGFVGGIRNFISSAVSVIKEMVGKVNFGNVIKAIGLTSALINITSFLRRLKNIPKKIGGIFDSLKETIENIGAKKEEVNIADNILKIVSAIGILVVALWGISKIDQDRLDRSVEILAGLSVGMLGFIFVLKKITKTDGKDISSAAGALLKISGSLLILIFSIKMLSAIDSNTLTTGLMRIAEILGVLAIFTKLAAVPSGSKLSGYFSLAVSLVIIAHEVKYLSRIDTAAFMKGLLGMGAILLELAIFSRLTKSSNFSGAGRKNPPFIKMAIAVVLFSQVLKGVAYMNPNKLVQGIAGFGAILLELAIFSRLTKSSNFSGAGRKNPPFIKMAIAVGLFAFILKGISKMDPDKLAQGIAGLGAILLEIGIFSRLMTGANFNFKSTILMLVSLGGSLLLFMEAMNRTANISGAKMMAFSLSFGIIIGTLSKTLTALSLMPFGAILGAVTKLGTIIGLTGVFIGGIGALTQQFPQIQGWLDSGGEALGAVGTAIGKFIQGIVNPNGTSTGSGFSLADLGTDLGNFVTNAQPFFTKISSLTEGELKNIGGLAAAVTDLTAAAALSKGKSAAGVGEYLGELGTGLYSFSENAKDIDPKAILGTESSLKMLTRIYKNLPEIGGVVQFIVGRQDLSVFAKGIKTLGASLKGYSDNAKKVDASAVAGTEAGLTMLKDIYNNLTPIGGIAMILFGEVDPVDFALGMESMGKGLKRYSEQIKDVKSEDVKTSAEALAELAKIYEYLPDIGGIAGFIFGDQNLLKFGEALAPLGEGIGSFAGSIKDYSNFSNVSKAATALKDLAGIYADLPRVGRIAGLLLGNKNLQKMGEALPKLGEGIGSFKTSLGETSDFSNVSAAATALKDLAGIHEYLPKLGGLAGRFLGDKDLGKFGGDLKTFGDNLHAFASNFVGDSYSVVDEGLANSKGIFDSLKTLLSDMSENEENTDYNMALTNFNGLMDTIIFYLETYYPEFYRTGSSLMSNLSDGANSVSDYPVNIFTTTANSVIRSLNSHNTDFYVVGLNYAVGIANGIIRGGRTVVSAATSVANSAINASRRGFDEHSPSKEGFAIGAFFTEGIANGMTQLANLTNRASEQVSSDAIHTAQAAMSMINSIIESGDVAPTICPVLDLSNIANGAGQINSLLGKNRTLMANSINVYSLNQRAASLQSGINQNGSLGRNNNHDVVEAINSLGARIDTMNEDIKNLKVVLNTGIVAGELAPEINRRLGIIAAYEERGI